MFVHLNEQELFIKWDLLGVPKAQNTDNGDQFQGLWLLLCHWDNWTTTSPHNPLCGTEHSGFMISGDGQFFLAFCYLWPHNI